MKFSLCSLLFLLFLGCTTSQKIASEKPEKTSPPAKGNSTFDYEGYLRKNKIQEQWEKQKKKKQREYEKILHSMAEEIQKKWKRRRQEAEKLYRKARAAYQILDFQKAYHLLKELLSLVPSHVEGRELFDRLLFFRNERSLLFRQVLSLRKKEWEEFGKARQLYLKKMKEEIQRLYKQKKWKEAREKEELWRKKISLVLHYELFPCEELFLLRKWAKTKSWEQRQ